MTRNLLVEVQRGQLLVQPVSEGRGAGERSPVSKPPDKGSLGVDANLQAATRVNPRVASSHRTPPAGGLWERRASFPGAKAATGAVRTSVAALGSPAYQGWHAGTVAGGNAGDPTPPGPISGRVTPPIRQRPKWRGGGGGGGGGGGRGVVGETK